MVDVGFVILTWNSEKYIERCLSSIQECQGFAKKICVVDNGSEDATSETVLGFQRKYSETKIDFIRLEKNLGTTISRNIGIRVVERECRYVCILDSDAAVTEQAVNILIRELIRSPENGIVGPLMRDEAGNIQNTARNIPTLQEKLLKVMPIKRLREKGELLEGKADTENGSQTAGYLLSACWLMRSELFQTTGYLDEKIFYAPEDVEFCLRIWVSGFRVIYCPEAKILHSWQRLSRKRLFSKHNLEHIKGLFYLFRKYRYLFSLQRFERYMK